jgi:hypothetical protein
MEVRWWFKFLCGFKIPKVFGSRSVFAFFWFSKDIYTLMEQSKDKAKSIFFAVTRKVTIWFLI